MTPEELRERARFFARNIVLLCRSLPNDWVAKTLGGQLLRAGTAVAANYRAACRGRSGKEFCAKLGLVAEESDESVLWLDLLLVGHPGVKGKLYDELTREANELTAIFSASYGTARSNLQEQKRRRQRRNSEPHEITKSPNP